MIGVIINTLEDYVRKHGKADWRQILQMAGLDQNCTFGSARAFSDQLFMRLIGAAAELLQQSVPQTIQETGVHFPTYAEELGYGPLIGALGPNIVEFLFNLNALHLHLSIGMPAMRPPTFAVEEITHTSVILHYRSQRVGLQPFVVGILKGVGRRFFQHDIQVELLRGREDGTCDHDVMRVSFPHQRGVAGVVRRLAVLTAGSTNAEWEDDAGGYARASSGSLEAESWRPQYTMGPLTFFQLHPFHLVLDRQLRVVQAGEALQRVVPHVRGRRGSSPGSSLTDTFNLLHPMVAPLSFEAMSGALQNSFLLQVRSTGLELKGQMVRTALPPAPSDNDSSTGPGSSSDGGRGACDHAGEEVLLFLASPRVANLDELRAASIFLSDLPLWDVSRDFVLLAEQRHAEASQREQLEILTRQLEATTRVLHAEQARTQHLQQQQAALLRQILPQQVISVLLARTEQQAAAVAGAAAQLSQSSASSSASFNISAGQLSAILDPPYQASGSQISSLLSQPTVMGAPATVMGHPAGVAEGNRDLFGSTGVATPIRTPQPGSPLCPTSHQRCPFAARMTSGAAPSPAPAPAGTPPLQTCRRPSYSAPQQPCPFSFSSSGLLETELHCVGSGRPELDLQGGSSSRSMQTPAHRSSLSSWPDFLGGRSPRSPQTPATSSGQTPSPAAVLADMLHTSLSPVLGWPAASSGLGSPIMSPCGGGSSSATQENIRAYTPPFSPSERALRDSLIPPLVQIAEGAHALASALGSGAGHRSSTTGQLVLPTEGAMRASSATPDFPPSRDAGGSSAGAAEAVEHQAGSEGEANDGSIPAAQVLPHILDTYLGDESGVATLEVLRAALDLAVGHVHAQRRCSQPELQDWGTCQWSAGNYTCGSFEPWAVLAATGAAARAPVPAPTPARMGSMEGMRAPATDAAAADTQQQSKDGCPFPAPTGSGGEGGGTTAASLTQGAVTNITPSGPSSPAGASRRAPGARQRRGSIALPPYLSRQDVMDLATMHEEVTVLFADIKNFTAMCQELHPTQVMLFLNHLFSLFDILLEEHDVYKVETIGDCYMVAAGLFGPPTLMVPDPAGGQSSTSSLSLAATPIGPERPASMLHGNTTRKLGGADVDHAQKGLQFAKAMLMAASHVLTPTGEPVQLRVGMHCGPCMSGVVGRCMPRFCLYGDTVNTASRMESTGESGRIHVSAAFAAKLPHESWLATGGVEAKGKGVMQTFLLAEQQFQALKS